jgi:hypothetical protein
MGRGKAIRAPKTYHGARGVVMMFVGKIDDVDVAVRCVMRMLRGVLLVRRCVAWRVSRCHGDVQAQAIGDVRAFGRLLRSGFEDEQGFDSVYLAILEETSRVRANEIWSEMRDVFLDALVHAMRFHQVLQRD